MLHNDQHAMAGRYHDFAPAIARRLPPDKAIGLTRRQRAAKSGGVARQLAGHAVGITVMHVSKSAEDLENFQGLGPETLMRYPIRDGGRRLLRRRKPFQLVRIAGQAKRFRRRQFQAQVAAVGHGAVNRPAGQQVHGGTALQREIRRRPDQRLGLPVIRIDQCQHRAVSFGGTAQQDDAVGAT